MIEQLCWGSWRTPTWLGQQLGKDPAKLSERHLSPMVRAGILERRFPDTPTHAAQPDRTLLHQDTLLASKASPSQPEGPPPIALP